MNVKGFFALLASTIWRSIFTQLLAEFRYRVAGGSDNALLPERKGRAILQKVYGKTVKFNQLVQNGNFAGKSHWTSWSISPVTLGVAGNVATISKYAATPYGGFLYNDGITPNATHKYYLTAKLARVDASAYFGFITSSGTEGGNTILASFTTNLDKYALITSPSSNTDKLCLRCGLGSTAINSSCKAADVMAIDLTDTFGTDAEIAAALGITTSQITQSEGVAAFEAWLALNVGAQDYYPYDEGSLISFKGQGVKVTGWNKFHVVNGSGVADVKKDVKYYVAGPFGSLHYSDGTAISVASDRTFTAIKDDTITFGSVSNSIVLNIYTGTAKDGTYEPYHEEIVDLSGAYINVWDEQWEPGGIDYQTGINNNSTASIRSKGYTEVSDNITYYAKYNSSTRIYLRFYNASKTYIGQGPLNSDNTFTPLANTAYLKFQLGSSSYPVSPQVYNYDVCINVSNADINGTYYPHALQSAGSVTDEDTATELTKKVGVIKLKDLTDWTIYNATNHIFRVNIPLKAIGVYNLLCNKYKTASEGVVHDHLGNLEICGLNNSTYPGYTYVRNNDCTTITGLTSTFTEDDVVQYELATPIVVPHDTPMQYAVDKHSTEELLVPASVAGEPTSTAIVADIEYQAK